MRYRFLILITALLTATLLISNTLDTKIFTVMGLNLPAGIILFPLAYLAGDVLTEVYGYAIARRVIWSSIIALLMMVGAYEIARLLPPAGFWENQVHFDAILSHVPRLVLASILAYICGEFTNSLIVAKMKVATAGKYMSARFITSTIFGQLVDTTVFIAVAFSGVLALNDMVSVLISAWLLKVAWEVVALPFTLLIVRALKKAEGEDHYDRSTNFNPFKM